MLDFSEEFLKIIKSDEILNNLNDEYIKSIMKRDKLFKDTVRCLNNHREELREEYGIIYYNYSDVCSVEDGDALSDMDYCFKVVFDRLPSAHDLSIIEKITGCEFRGQMQRNPRIFYYALPKIIHYDFPNQRR